jgi:hypothetical protein
VRYDRIDRREKLRLLDGCLEVLEDDHQRGEVVVSAAVAARLRQHVGGVAVGMLIADAIELVFAEQEPCLSGSWSEGGAHREAASAERAVELVAARAAGGRGQPLTEACARALTERIRNATQHVCLLLREAHEGRAWSALGYRTWEQYVKREFNLSRSRSYELLDQGRVIAELQMAAGLSEIPDISAYAAVQIKPYLAEVTTSIRERARKQPGARLVEIIGDVVRQQRARIRELQEARRQHASAALSISRPELDHLYTAIQCLAQMPDAVDIVAQIPDEASQLSVVEPALQWLSDFVEELRRRALADALRQRAQCDEGKRVAVGA